MAAPTLIKRPFGQFLHTDSPSSRSPAVLVPAVHCVVPGWAGETSSQLASLGRRGQAGTAGSRRDRQFLWRTSRRTRRSRSTPLRRPAQAPPGGAGRIRDVAGARAAGGGAGLAEGARLPGLVAEAAFGALVAARGGHESAIGAGRAVRAANLALVLLVRPLLAGLVAQRRRAREVARAAVLARGTAGV